MNPTDFINLRMMAHPVNWLIVWTVLLFAGTAWHFLRSGGDAAPVASTDNEG